MSATYSTKPKADDWLVDYVSGSGWHVVSPDAGYSEQAFANRNAALSARGHAKAQAAKSARCRERPCMTCRNSFLSEGPHHRMCTICRHKGQDLDPVRPYITRRS